MVKSGLLVSEKTVKISFSMADGGLSCKVSSTDHSLAKEVTKMEGVTP